tara:strand:+ start:489 stop:1376 length:888 start_codon:yes stop_codon:yes gene_type:complete
MDQLNKYHYYINLEKRKERNIHCKNELKKIGINPRRFNAIEEKIGLIGCTKSHIKCVEIAKKKKWPFICIFEDDILFLKPDKVIQNINKYIDYNYDVLYIGSWIRDEKYNIINDDLVKVKYACCAHAYIVKQHYYDIYLNNLYNGLDLKIKDPSNYKYNNDEYIQILQEKDNWLCFHPILVTQKNGYSDNFNEIRNYKEKIREIPTVIIPINTIPKIFKKKNEKDKIMDCKDKKEDEENITLLEKDNIKKVEVTEELLKNIRNILEVTNDRVNWKIEELLPVGLVVQQIDILLKE